MATISGTWLFNEVISRPSVDIYTFNGWEKGHFVSSAFNQTRLHYDGTDLEYRSASDDVVVYNFYTNKWENSDYRSIDFGTTPQEVDEAFYTWFTANATKQVEEENYTLSGKWIFNETLNGIVGDIPLWPTQNVNEISFISSPNRYGDKNYIAFVFHQTVTANESLVLAYRFPYENENGFALENVYIYEPVLDDEQIGWVDKSFRIVNFGTTPQTVSDAFYEWFTSNANPYVEEEEPEEPEEPEETPKPKIATFDLSTLNLEIGTHTVTAKSKKKYYNDSENSNSVIYDKDLLYELSEDGSYYSVIGIGNYDKTDVVIPSLYKGLPVSIIGNSAFRGLDNIKSVIIGSKVTRIEWGAFYQCQSLTSVTISNSVTYIDGYAFAYCPKLVNIEIPNSVTDLRYNVFAYCTALESVTIGYKVKEIEERAFFNCRNLKNIKIGTSVRSIGEYAFGSCVSLTSLTIPASAGAIYKYAFSGCKSLNSVTFEGNDMVWYIMHYNGFYNKPVNVSNKEDNAIYLTKTYVSYEWQDSEY